MKTIHLVSGLPRAGSTLLMNLLGQNPRFHVTPTSACSDVLFTLRNKWSEWIEHESSDMGKIEHLRRTQAAVLQTYHPTDKPVVFDKGRGWISLMEMGEFVTGQPIKVIVPVRDPRAIFSSLEKIYRKKSASHQTHVPADYLQAQTVAGRTEIEARIESPMGLAYSRVKDAVQRGFTDRMLFVRFKELTTDPQQVINDIYKFTGEEQFDHDFLKVEQITHEDDSVHGADLHTIRTKIEPVPNDWNTILGRDVAQKYANLDFWNN